ncbi:hypothetical protein [Streptomyces smaragdinus]|nr:hypothetical protein [Streptomyces smaragdinus]
MRTARILVGVAAVAALATGCNPEQADTESTDSASAPATPAAGESAAAPAEALAVPVTGPQDGVAKSTSDMADPSGKPPSGADFATQIRYALRTDALHKALVEAETSADCPDGITQQANAVSKCTVTYGAAKIPYTVTIGANYKEGSFITPYRAEPQGVLLIAKRVQNEFWNTFGKTADELSCDEMPEAQTVKDGDETEFHCQAKGLGGDPSQVTLFKVVVKTYGPSFVRQDS